MKSKFLTIVFSAVPGVGHLYLGLMNRGLQLMLVFATAVMLYIFLELGALFVFIPVIWFYSLFDALQQHQLIREGIYEDTPLPFWNKIYFSHKWVAYLLIGTGAYIFLEKALRYLGRFLPIDYYFFRDFRSLIVAIVLIFIGYQLLTGTKLSRRTEETSIVEVEKPDEN